MSWLINITSALLTPAYCATVAAYGISLFRKSGRAEGWSRPILIVTLLIHSVLIYAETVEFGHCLVYSPFELMTMIAFTVTLTYLIVELVTGERGTGIFFIGLALFFQILSGMFSPEMSIPANSPLLEYVVGLHISSAIFAYSGFTMSAVWGVLYLMQHHEIKANRFGLLYNRLPSLGLLERMSAVAVIVGLVFLSIAILIALMWLPEVLPGFTYHDPKVIATVLVWILYAAAVVMKYLLRVDQRRFVILSLVGFAGLFLSMTIVNLVLSGFHDFR
ncbi:MAG: inner membrane protein YpjD [Candidatus Kapaibacterium sp.]